MEATEELFNIALCLSFSLCDFLIFAASWLTRTVFFECSPDAAPVLVARRDPCPLAVPLTLMHTHSRTRDRFCSFDAVCSCWFSVFWSFFVPYILRQISSVLVFVFRYKISWLWRHDAAIATLSACYGWNLPTSYVTPETRPGVNSDIAWQLIYTAQNNSLIVLLEHKQSQLFGRTSRPRCSTCDNHDTITFPFELVRVILIWYITRGFQGDLKEKKQQLSGWHIDWVSFRNRSEGNAMAGGREFPHTTPLR